jgi:hypothetical protein
MSTFARLKTTYKIATNTTLGSLGIVIPMVIIPAAIYGYSEMEAMSSLTQQAQDLAGQGQAPNFEQSLLIGAALKLTALDIILELIFGPIIAAAAIYTVATKRDGREPTLYGAMNFALKKYSRLFKWHAAAQLSIKLGMLILIPGVLFMMMYAMVDPVLCFEKEKWPLDRSKRLTRVWRKTLFVFMMPWVVMVAVVPLVLFWSSQQGGLLTFGISIFYYSSLFWLQAGFCWLYLERLEAGRKAMTIQMAATQQATEARPDESPVQAGSPDKTETPKTKDPVIPRRKKGVEPMGTGQKIGLGLVALIIGTILYGSCTKEKQGTVDPTSPTGQPLPLDPADEEPVEATDPPPEEPNEAQ